MDRTSNRRLCGFLGGHAGFSCCDRAFSAGVSLRFRFWVIFMTGHMVGHGVLERKHSI